MPAQRTLARRSGRARTRYLTSALSGTLSVPWRNLPAVPLLLLFPHLHHIPHRRNRNPKVERGRENGGGWGCRGVAGGEGASLSLHPINQAGTILSRSLGRGFWDANALGERQRPVGGGGEGE